MDWNFGHFIANKTYMVQYFFKNRFIIVQRKHKAMYPEKRARVYFGRLCFPVCRRDLEIYCLKFTLSQNIGFSIRAYMFLSASRFDEQRHFTLRLMFSRFPFYCVAFSANYEIRNVLRRIKIEINFLHFYKTYFD